MSQGVYLNKARYANGHSVFKLQSDLVNFSSRRLRRVLDGTELLPSEYESAAETSAGVTSGTLAQLRQGTYGGGG